MNIEELIEKYAKENRAYMATVDVIQDLEQLKVWLTYEQGIERGRQLGYKEWWRDAKKEVKKDINYVRTEWLPPIDIWTITTTPCPKCWYKEWFINTSVEIIRTCKWCWKKYPKSEWLLKFCSAKCCAEWNCVQ